MSAPREVYDAAMARSTVDAMIAADAFSRWLGVELLALGDGTCSLAMTVRDEMVNGFGVTHGGIAFSLADSAMAFACNQRDAVTVAVDNGVSYPAPIRPGDRLVAEAKCEARAGRLAWYQVSVRNQEAVVVCLFRGTVYETRRQHRELRTT